ncbi:hypothetical protein D3C86_2074750 [compost metagenome]
MFPVPVALTTKSRLSPFFKEVFDGVTLKSSLPTAPVNPIGLFTSGSALTLIVLAPAETVLFPSSVTIRPNISRPLGT